MGHPSRKTRQGKAVMENMPGTTARPGTNSIDGVQTQLWITKSCVNERGYVYFSATSSILNIHFPAMIIVKVSAVFSEPYFAGYFVMFFFGPQN